MGDRMPSLEAAVERLYQVFSVIPKPKSIKGCPCCINDKEIGVLLRTPLRQLSPNDMSSYASSAFLTVGESADHLYFLPRILEVISTEPSWWPGPEVTARAILNAGPEAWTAEQRDAVHVYLLASVGKVIDDGQYLELDGWVCAVVRMGRNVQPFLDLIARCPAAVLIYFEMNSEALQRNRLSNGFWEVPSAGHDVVVDWFYSPEIAKIPFEAYGYVLSRG